MLSRKPNGMDEMSGIPLPPNRFESASRSPTVAVPSPAPVVRKSPFEGMKCEGAVLIGAGARVQGDISNSSMVEIQGILEGNVVTNTLVVREGGGFKGDMQAQHAEVHGSLEGTLNVQDLLDIRATGRVSAEASYGKLAVSAGGSIAGQVQVKSPVVLEDMRTDDASPESRTNRNGNGMSYGS